MNKLAIVFGVLSLGVLGFMFVPAAVTKPEVVALTAVEPVVVSQEEEKEVSKPKHRLRDWIKNHRIFRRR